MIPVLRSVLAVTEDTAPLEPSNVGIGSVVLTIVATAFLAWVGYLVLSSRRRRAAVEETPSNLQPYLSDDELENTRVTRVLNAAVVASAVLAIALPIYYLNEGDRQAAAAEARQERDIEEGEHWYTNFSCINCHGPDGGGGAAPFAEPRSGLDVAWTAPSINDVFLRYSEDEMRYWVVYGRAGTPMPANGLEGGGAMTVQEVDQVVEYLRSISISQGQALDEVERIVPDALARIENGDATVARLILEQEAELDDTLEAPDQFAAIETFPGDVDFILAGNGTCTDASAALVGSTCGDTGVDSDRDGLTDAAEERLTEIGGIIDETILVRSVRDVTDEGTPVLDENGDPMLETVQVQDPDLPELYGLELDPTTGFTDVNLAGEPIADLDRVAIFLSELDTAHLTLSVIAERQDVFLSTVESGLEFLQESAEERLWDVDFDQVAADTGLDREDAERAVGLYNGYCARCHTAGYAAGVAFEQPAGSGAWGPALWDGRSVVQFPSADDHVDFITRGSNANENYGVNGIGRGWMPGFGEILSVEDIELIVAYERSL